MASTLRTPGVLEQIAFFNTKIRDFHRRGWALATSTNYSFRLEAKGPVWITASGRDKALLGEQDWLAVDEGGQALEPDAPRSSAETELHLDLYRQLPDLGAVAHTHSVAGTVLSRRYLNRQRLELAGFEMQKALPGIVTHQSLSVLPVVGNSQHMPDILAELQHLLADTSAYGPEPWPALPGYLIAGHGLYAWGKNSEQSIHRIEALEFLLACRLEEDRYGSPQQD